MSINKCIFVGRLVKDPEVRSAGASTVCNFSIALNESYTDKRGQKVDKVEYVNIVTWNKLADICAKFLVKGSEVFVEAKVQTETYEKNGEKRYATKFTASNVQFFGRGSAQETEDDDLPF